MESTVNQYTYIIANFIKGLDGQDLDKEAIRDFLSKYSNHSKYRYSNVLKALRIFVRDYLGKGELIKSFSFPHIGYEYREVPTKEQFKRFFQALDNPMSRCLALLYATSGLRRDEVRKSRIKDLDRANRMIKPADETSRTKGRFVSFWNSECDEVLSEYLGGFDGQDPETRLFPISGFEVNRIFNKASKRSNVKIKPTDLRRFFASEMAKLGVSETYINCYQGRLPRSVLSRHYLDLSKERLKEIYDKANLKVLS